MCSIQQIEQRLHSMLLYMNPFWDFVNCHMVNYLTDEHWMTFVPEKVREDIRTAEDVALCIKTQFWGADHHGEVQFPAIAGFLAAGKQEMDGFRELLTSLEDLEQQLPQYNFVTEAGLSIKEFMSAKKCHEVDLTAALVHKLIQRVSKKANCEDFCIVDAGDGKGYLSSCLALQYEHHVLGVDANPTNTENALARNRRLQLAWNGLTERAVLQSQGIIPKRRQNKTNAREKAACRPNNYKTTTVFMTNNLDLGDLVSQHFPQESIDAQPYICLTGLHTCGNLATTCLQVFQSQARCEILCNIGCCYHFLKERYSHLEFFGNKTVMDIQTDFGFPLSRYLQNRQVGLGRNARMLAAQSVERTLATKELPNISLYYRALLELLVCQYRPHLKNELQVGKIRKFSNFEDYVNICSKKLNAAWLTDINNAELNALQNRFELDKHYLDLFYLLRMSFAPILEGIILLDRLLYLKELGHERSFLVPLFDAVISPRFHAIVALK